MKVSRLSKNSLFIENSLYRLTVFFDISEQIVEAETEIAKSDYSGEKTSQQFSIYLYNKIPEFMMDKAQSFNKPVLHKIKRAPAVASAVGRKELSLESWLKIFGEFLSNNNYKMTESNRVWEKKYTTG